MRYYISDLHFYHESMNTKMDCRGFENAEKMNEYMIKKWNDRVGKKDEVVVIGDFSVAGAKETNDILTRLNGDIYLIVGNHDRFINYRKNDVTRFKWIKDYMEMHDNGRKVILSHYPIMCYNGQYKLDKNGRPHTYMLYGHVHDSHDEKLITEFERITRETVVPGFDGESRSILCNMINCFCGYSDYTPLTLDEWIELTDRRRGTNK